MLMNNKEHKYNTKLSKIFILALLCALMFTSCAPESEANIDVRELSGVIGDKIDLSNTVEYSSEQIKNNYGIAAEDVIQIIVLKEMDVNSAEALILLEATDAGKAEEIENKLKVYKTYKLNELANYAANPDNENQYYIVDGADIVVEGRYVFWAAYKESGEINDLIKEYIENHK